MASQLGATESSGLLSAELGEKRANSTLFKAPRVIEGVIRSVLLFCGVASIFTTIGILVVLGSQSLLFFQTTNAAGEPAVSLVEFFTGTIWQPRILQFGVLPLVSATLQTTFWAMVVAIPLGLGSAIYLAEYAPLRVRSIFKPVLELLAGIPTVVYGYFAITFMTPLLRSIFGADTVGIYNMLSPGLVMGFMILPTIASISEDSLSAVPRALREASYGLGATKFETIIQVVLPAALSGLLAAFLLGISRGFGETMIVALAAGAGPNLTFNPFEAAETITGHIARISGGDLPYGSIDYNSLFSLGLVLFFVTLILNVISRQIMNRFREAY